MLEAWQLVAEPFGSIEADWRFKSAACPVLTAVEPPKNVTRRPALLRPRLRTDISAMAPCIVADPGTPRRIGRGVSGVARVLNSRTDADHRRHRGVNRGWGRDRPRRPHGNRG